MRKKGRETRKIGKERVTRGIKSEEKRIAGKTRACCPMCAEWQEQCFYINEILYIYQSSSCFPKLQKFPAALQNYKTVPVYEIQNFLDLSVQFHLPFI